MLIIGDELLGYKNFIKIVKLEEIKNTKNCDVLCFDFNKNLLAFCKENDLACGVFISSLREAIYANAFFADYLLLNEKTNKDLGKEFTKKVQDIANEYIFDSKVLAVIDSEDEIEELALKGIDGVIFQSIIKNIED